MTIHEIEKADLNSLRDITSKIAKLIQCGLEQRFIVESGQVPPAEFAQAIRQLILEEGLDCHITPLCRDRGRLPDRKGIWIIGNADVATQFAIAAWLKTQLDILHPPALKVILVVQDRDLFVRGCQHSACIGATPV